MKVSVIVPLYGVERYVEQCARSLFEQSYESIEFIFVDDSSPDRSSEIVERVLAEYPHQLSRTKILRNEQNMGVSAARNRALEAVTGHFVLFVDGDDWCAPNLVEELAIEQMEFNSDVVTSNFYEESDHRSKVVKASPIGGRRGSLRIVVSQSFDLPNRVWGILMRRATIMEHNIRFDCRITMGEDFLFLVQVLYHARRMAHLSMALYHYRVGVGAMSNIGQRARKSYIRAIAASHSFISQQSDYKEFRVAVRLAKYNLRRWLLLRNSRRLTPCSVIYRLWCYTLNSLYHLYCISYLFR